jgi:lysophospholipase L1-like esterase
MKYYKPDATIHARHNINPWILFAVILAILAVSVLSGCRRVTLIGDSLFAGTRDTIVQAINDNDGESWVYTEHLWPGSTCYNNPVNHEIYGEGIVRAFGMPDVVVFSFATNDMGRVLRDAISMESAIESMQTLINQSVAAGSMCVVMFESSHRLRGNFADNPTLEMYMDDWSDHWHRKVGENTYLGIPYTFLIADISAQVEADLDAYIGDYIHLNQAGAELAAAAVVEQINQCPQGRWVFGENVLRADAAYPVNPYLEYVIPR